MRESRKWYLLRQLCMCSERITMFVGGIFIGAQDIGKGLVLLIISGILHSIEHEGHFRSIRSLMGEEVEEHTR